MEKLLRVRRRQSGTVFVRKLFLRGRYFLPVYGAPFVSGIRIPGFFRRFIFPVSQMN